MLILFKLREGTAMIGYQAYFQIEHLLPYIFEYKSPSHISRSRILSQFLRIMTDSHIRHISVGLVTSENFALSIDRDLR